MEASIVIPVYNQSFYTRVCLASLELEQGDAEVLVVDNGSTDDTPELLADWAPAGRNRHVLRHRDNLGFARACNAGARAASGSVIVFLNNDTFVLPGWLKQLLRPFADPSVQITGCRLLYPSGHIQHAGVAFDDLGPHHIFVGLPGDSPAVLEERDYQVVTGAALAVRRDEFWRLQGFDASYENSFEDVDLCLRVRRDGGRVVYVPNSVAYHFESVTEGRVGPTDMRNYELFMQRWEDKFERDLPCLEAAAVKRGIDLRHNRVPSRREVMDRERHLAAAQWELGELRAMRQMRSVRTALWLRNLFRTLVPARR